MNKKNLSKRRFGRVTGEKLDKKIKVCVEEVLRDPESGADYIRRLILAEKIKSLKFQWLPQPLNKKYTDKDERAKVAYNVGGSFVRRILNDRYARINNLSKKLMAIGGISFRVPNIYSSIHNHKKKCQICEIANELVDVA